MEPKFISFLWRGKNDLKKVWLLLFENIPINSNGNFLYYKADIFLVPNIYLFFAIKFSMDNIHSAMTCKHVYRYSAAQTNYGQAVVT